MSKKVMRCLVGCVILSSGHLVLAVTTYHVTILPDLSGGVDYARPNAINDLGQVVGEGMSETGGRAVLWANGVPQNLGELPTGTDWSAAMDINNAGQVVGNSSVNGPRGSSTSHGFLWTAHGGMVDLGTLPNGLDSTAVGINNHGQVTGESNLPSADGRYVESTNGYRYTSGAGFVDIGDLPGGYKKTVSYTINNAGHIVGDSGTRNSLGYFSADHAFLWKPETGIVDLGDLPGGGDGSWAQGINDFDIVVGQSEAENGLHAFMWDSARGMRDIGTLAYRTATYACAINNLNQVVGFAPGFDDSFSRAVLWEEGKGWVDLNRQLDLASDVTLLYAFDINNRGQIVGMGLNQVTGNMVAYMLTPVPEPGCLLAYGLPFMLRACRRAGRESKARHRLAE